MEVAMHGDRFRWGQAGSVYYLVDRGTIIALLYFEGEGVGQEGGPGGEPVVTPAAWCWLAVNDPDQHYELDAPAMTADMTDADLAAVNDAALEAAAGQILDYLDRAGRL
jgi:hypothetical protein